MVQRDTTQNRAINPATSIAPIGLFSNGLLSKPGRVLGIAGQCGLVNIHEPLGFEEQTRNCWKSIKAIVEEAGGSMGDLVSVNIYFRDANPAHYKILGEVRREFLQEPYPASTAIAGVQFMLPAMDIEIQALAVIPEPPSA